MTDNILVEQEVVHQSLLMIMGVIYQSGLVDSVSMSALMTILGTDPDTAADYDDVYVSFDEDFFREYEEHTGVDLRNTPRMLTPISDDDDEPQGYLH